MMPDSLAQSFQEKFYRPPEFTVRAPGRVNLLGEHVDYNEGIVLPVALDRAVRLAVSKTEDQQVTLHALDLGAQVSFNLSELSGKIDSAGQELPAWALYPAGVAWSLLEAGLSVTGLQAIYTSNLPIGSGLSSSAAVEVGFAIAWQELGGWNRNGMELAILCQRAENAYVRVNCGLMDQFASACGVEAHALYFDTRSLEWEALPLPPGTVIVVADSGIRRNLATSAYNERRAACEQAVKTLRVYLPHIHSLRDVSAPEFAAYGEYLPQPIRRRAEHVIKEIARVQSAASALRRGEASSFGALMFSGHASLRDLYEVSTPELDALVEIARSLPGCLGARLTGAGFGGCTVNLVEERCAEDFVSRLESLYQERTHRSSQVYLCQASAGAAVEA